MKLKELLKGVCDTELDLEVSGISFNASEIKEGEAYFCLVGSNADGHDYASKAQERGASVIISQRELEGLKTVVVYDTRKALSLCASNFYGNPENRLTLIGVTGTNGKTTTTHIIRDILESKGYSVGLIGTQGSYLGRRFYGRSLTTPDPTELFKLFREMLNMGASHIVMEVSAHALKLKKLYGLEFDIGVLTNITEDHLDYFKTMKSYASAKLSFLRQTKLAILCIDDELIRQNYNRIKGHKITYGLHNPSDCFAIDITKSPSGTAFTLNLFDNVITGETRLVGEYNVLNLIAGASACMLLGLTAEEIKKSFKYISVPKGRFNVLNVRGVDVVVDFAHTPDGLEKVLLTARDVTKGRVFCLFGCGGNRDSAKRSLMGRIAETHADYVFVTSDNPRFENPLDIMKDIERGMKKRNHECESNRELAIKKALKSCKEGDMLLICGKGDEPYQDVNGVKVPYSDFDVLKEV